MASYSTPFNASSCGYGVVVVVVEEGVVVVVVVAIILTRGMRPLLDALQKKNH
jgi:hypothetical protein